MTEWLSVQYFNKSIEAGNKSYACKNCNAVYKEKSKFNFTFHLKGKHPDINFQQEFNKYLKTRELSCNGVKYELPKIYIKHSKSNNSKKQLKKPMTITQWMTEEYFNTVDNDGKKNYRCKSCTAVYMNKSKFNFTYHMNTVHPKIMYQLRYNEYLSSRVNESISSQEEVQEYNIFNPEVFKLIHSRLENQQKTGIKQSYSDQETNFWLQVHGGCQKYVYELMIKEFGAPSLSQIKNSRQQQRREELAELVDRKYINLFEMNTAYITKNSSANINEEIQLNQLTLIKYHGQFINQLASYSFDW
ncbi:Hypothetical_protein [Hexamita inflata]|uniref:Hypothetical_protein n=1 Tax=Hexamita inflata TaxID=28002 RepID=A0AA86N872_9EUKA|nr:Hypothetical protein HINF_LOCUS2230 [Hexamita inflata]